MPLQLVGCAHAWRGLIATAVACGVVSAAPATVSFTTLHSFDSSPSGWTTGNGANAGLIADAAGNLYGTTRSGGSGGDGTLYRIDAVTRAHSTIVNFNGSNGAGPNGGLIADAAGNMYGFTNNPSTNDGTVYKLPV